MKYMFSFEPLIVWIRYYKTINLQSFISNFIMPIIICIIILLKKPIIDVNEFFTVLITISAIFIGFCASILIMLITTNNEKVNKLKTENIKNTKVNLHEAMIYKFSFIVYNLIVLIFMILFSLFFNYVNLLIMVICIFILLNSIMTLIEALTNSILVFSK